MITGVAERTFMVFLRVPTNTEAQKMKGCHQASCCCMIPEQEQMKGQRKTLRLAKTDAYPKSWRRTRTNTLHNVLLLKMERMAPPNSTRENMMRKLVTGVQKRTRRQSCTAVACSQLLKMRLGACFALRGSLIKYKTS